MRLHRILLLAPMFLVLAAGRFVQAGLVPKASPPSHQLRVLKNGGSHLNVTQSTNWAGYQIAAGPLAYNSIQATWIVPAIVASSTDTASAAWIGIGGGCTDPPTCAIVEPTLIQAGTSQDNSGGQPTYSAWWEALPAPSVPISGGIISSGQSFDVQAGDSITVTISASPAVLWSILIEDARANIPQWTFSTTVPYIEPGLTAEWIMESPLTAGTGGAGQIALSNFGRITFTGLEVDNAPPTLTSNDEIIMTDGSGNILAQPSAASGNAFSACYGSGACR